MHDKSLFEFLKEHEHEDIRIYSTPEGYLQAIKITMYLNTMAVSRIIGYEELMSPVFPLRDILNDMYEQFEKEDK